jgi:hypothetical protein
MTKEELYKLCKEKVEYHKELFSDFKCDKKVIIEYIYSECRDFIDKNEKYKEKENAVVVYFIKETLNYGIRIGGYLPNHKKEHVI